MAMIAFWTLIVLAAIVIVRVILLKKYAQEFRGGEAKSVQNLCAFAHKYPSHGWALIALTILQYVIAATFFALFLIGLIRR